MSRKWHLLFLFFSISTVAAFTKSVEKNYFDSLSHINTKALSEKCMSQFTALEEKDTLTLIKMLDASAKIPDGLLSLNLYELGDFDACYKIKSEILEEPIYGKYCLGQVNISIAAENYGISPNSLLKLQKQPIITPEPRIALVEPLLNALQRGICVPSGCSAEELTGVITYSELKCYSEETKEPFSGGAKATIGMLSIFLAIAIISTLYDVYLRYSEQKTIHELLIAFSYLSNGEKIFATSTRSDHLLCLNGIRTLSMVWVIVGHLYTIYTGGPITNAAEALTIQEDPANMFLFGATVAVDSFFTLAGLVVVYTFLRMSEKGISISSMVLFYVHRYLRLTPLLGVVIIIYANLLIHFGDGPLWYQIKDPTDGCTTQYDKWWTLLLYVANYVKPEQPSCILVTWYLNIDTQLYFLSPIILVPLVYYPTYALMGLSVFIFGGFLAPGIVGHHFKLGAFFGGEGAADNFYQYYGSTYSRFGPYVIGMLVGYIIYRYKKTGVKPRLSPLMVCAAWLATCAVIVACVYGGYDLLNAKTFEIWPNVMFLAFNRNAWAIALLSVVYLCVTGYGGPIDKFLSTSVFQFFSKLSYSMYLIHYAMIQTRITATRTSYHFSHIEVMHAFWGDFMFTTAAALILSLTFEAPVIILEKHLINYVMGLFKKTEGNKKNETAVVA